MPKKKSAPKAGRLSMADMRALVNKKAGQEVAHDLKESNPTEVTQWIPTGCRWLDSIICRGRLAGLPVGKVVEIAGLEGTGKSYMAVQSPQTLRRWAWMLSTLIQSLPLIRHSWKMLGVT